MLPRLSRGRFACPIGALIVTFCASLVGCEGETFSVDVGFVTAEGQDPFGGPNFAAPDYLTLHTAYGGEDEGDFTFFQEQPERGAWEIPALPPGDAVTFTFEGLVSDPLDPDAQLVVSKGRCGPHPIQPEAADLLCLFTRKGVPGRLEAGLNVGRRSPAIVTLSGGDVVVFGGASINASTGPDLSRLDSVERFSVSGGPDSYRFVNVGTMRGARRDFTATYIEGTGTSYDGKVLLLGTREIFEPVGLLSGAADAAALDDALFLALPEIWDPETGEFSDFPAPAAQSLGWAVRAHHQSTLLDDGRVLVTGGLVFRVADFSPTDSAAPLIVTLRNDQVGLGNASMAEARYRHTATKLADGRVLIVGGARLSVDGHAARGSAELFSPQTGVFSLAGAIAPGRGDHGAVLLDDGRVLVFGGVDDTEAGFLTDAWAWNPTTELWAEVGSMSTARANATSQLLQDGRVLVCGGWNLSGPAPGCELFTPSSDEWSPLPDPSDQIAARAGSVSALLPDGEVLILGGYGANNNLLTDLLVYRP